MDKVREIVTPYEEQGILKRSNPIPKRGVPKRELPVYTVVTAAELDRVSHSPLAWLIRSIVKVCSSVTRDEIIALLATKCEVFACRLPAPLHAAAVNRGFAFAEV